MKVGYMI